jgi:Stress responsive A/B Barrel Domain
MDGGIVRYLAEPRSTSFCAMSSLAPLLVGVFVLVHLVLFRYRADIIESQRAAHRQALGRLADLPGVIELAVGPDVVGAPRSYDTGLLVKFPDRTALDAYAVHPRHLPVAALGRELSDSVVSADFLV